MQDPQIISLPVIHSKSGKLSFLDSNNALPFLPQRVYWIYGIDTEVIRGDHAHANADRVLICMNGTAVVRLEDEHGAEYHYRLDNPGTALFYPRMHWITMTLSARALLVTLASCTFEEDVVLNDYESFRNAAPK